MKKLVSLAIAAAMLGTLSCAALAAGENPTVYVNKGEIIFEDQEPVILGEGFTVVPARGVFEAMGAKVDWIADSRTVNVTSADQKTFVTLAIDDTEMKVYDTSNALANVLSGVGAPMTSFTLDVPAQIMNDRTMIPLRAISEALGANVQWDGEKYEIDITTADAPASQTGYPAYTLSAKETEVNEGENVDLFITLSNIPEGTYVSGVTATVKYDKDNFEFVGAKLVNGETEIEGALGAENGDYEDTYMKAAYVTVNASTAAQADGAVMKVTFKSKNGKEGAFELSNSYDTKLGYNTSLLVDKEAKEGEESEEKTAVMYEGTDLVVDKTPVVINAGK